MEQTTRYGLVAVAVLAALAWTFAPEAVDADSKAGTRYEWRIFAWDSRDQEVGTLKGKDGVEVVGRYLPDAIRDALGQGWTIEHAESGAVNAVWIRRPKK